MNTHAINIGNHVLDLVKLPRVAQEELVTFYEYLVFKYQGDTTTHLTNERETILKTIFQEANGKLPINYTFHRDELHER